MIFRAPGPRRFIARLTEDLVDRRSLLVLVPRGVGDADLWRAMWEELWRRDLVLREVWLPELQGGRALAAALGERIGVRWPSPNVPRTAASLVALPSLPDVICLGGYCDLTLEARGLWLNFMIQWAQAAKNLVDRGERPAALCLICPAWALESLPPPESLYLSVRYWWGIPSALEIQLLCRLSSEEASNDGCTSLWREYVLPSLVGNDVELAEWLWNEVYGDIDHLVSRLCEFAERRGWTREDLEELGLDTWRRSLTGSVASPSGPDSAYLRPWGCGMLCYTQEYGLELHSAALALLGRIEEIQHRLWRAQASLLLPILDGVRLELCQYLTRLYGTEWPVRWHPPLDPREETEVRENPLGCQWGHLEYLLKHYSALRAHRSWLQLVGLARSIRNRLAHYRTVEYATYAALYREVRRVREAL